MNDGFIVVVVVGVVANEVVIVDNMNVGTVADDGVDEDEREEDKTDDDDDGEEEEDDDDGEDDDDAYNEVVTAFANRLGACVVEAFIAGVCKAGGNKEVVSDLDNSTRLIAGSSVLATGVMVRVSNSAAAATAAVVSNALANEASVCARSNEL